jgi:hypothetical protein
MYNNIREVRLQWPTDLAIDPLDDTLHILDKNVIKMTKDDKLITIAGRPISQEFLPLGVLPDFPASPICTITSGVTVIDVNSLNNACAASVSSGL